MSDSLTLLTFAPMIDSEMARLLLRHYAVDYREEPHAFGWGSVLGLVRAGQVQVPILYGSGLRLGGPRAIFDHFEGFQSAERSLLPADADGRRTAEADWTLYNGTLATKTAVLAYYHLLPHRDVVIGPFTQGIPPVEAGAVRALFPLQRGLLTLLLKLNEANARTALTQIRAIFDQTDARIADGRRFLIGGRATLGDLALASAVAPVTLPEGNASPAPSFARLPPDYATIVTELRSRPTAAFVQRLYRSFAGNAA